MTYNTKYHNAFDIHKKESKKFSINNICEHHYEEPIPFPLGYKRGKYFESCS
jgi:hypothetical protein